MASIQYLWANRIKFPINSIQFYRAWAKRIICLPEQFKRNYVRNILVRNGAIIHQLAEIGNVKVDGKRNKLSIGENSFLGRVTIALFEEVTIGKNVCINDGVQLLTASHDVSDSSWKHTTAKIIIDDYAWIAINAIILPGVHIGKGAVVGAGAVVSKNVGAGCIVAGNPAKLLSKIRSQGLNYNPCAFLASNKAWVSG